MRRKILLSLLSIMFCAGGLMADNAIAEAHGSTSQSDYSYDETDNSLSAIWNGLWSGINLRFSNADSQGNRTAADTTPTVSQSTGRYVAMGDSVAAGLGLPLSSGASSSDRQCGRSPEAYPYVVAAARGLQLTDVACSGATAGDLITRQGIANAPNPSRQISAVFSGQMPKLITITAGANDAQWRRFIYKCYLSTCGTQTDTTIANGALVLLQAKLLAFFSELQLRSHGNPPTTVMTGYYNPLSASCNTQTARLTAAELTWIQSSVDALNTTIRDVTAVYPFARFAPVDFSGHDMCSADPWVQGLNDSAPIHPTDTGQQVIGRSILDTM